MISVIIPTLNESRALPRTLKALFDQDGDFEVILVDGGSLDDTISIAHRWPSIRILSSETGRARQLNAGAAVANGSMLLFLHADTLLPYNAIKILNALAWESRNVWGGFHQRFSGDAWPLLAISRIHNWRCAISDVFYGDQAMFVSRDLFAFTGGFADVEILEDIRLSETLLKLSAPIFLQDRVLTDSRKFEQMGPLRSFCRCLMILICYELRLPIRCCNFFAPIR